MTATRKAASAAPAPAPRIADCPCDGGMAEGYRPDVLAAVVTGSRWILAMANGRCRWS